MIWKLIALFNIGMGVLCIYFAAEGIILGEVTMASQRAEFTALQARNPNIFWGSILVYLTGGIFLISLGVYVFRKWK